MYIYYVRLEDQKGAGVNGGNAATGAWRTRDLNTEVADTGNVCTLAGNQFTLDAGTYLISAHAPAFRVEFHQTRLYNITDAALELLGTNAWNRPALPQAMTRSFVMGRFTIAAQKTFELQHRVDTTHNATGFGTPVAWGDNIYAVVELWQEI